MSEDNQHVVDPNTADIETLTQTPGIGPVLAERIIAARPYKTLEDLQWVNGISTTLLGQLRPYLTLPSAQKVEEGGVAPAEGITAEAEPETAPEALPQAPGPAAEETESVPSGEAQPPKASPPVEEETTAPQVGPQTFEQEAGVSEEKPAAPEEALPSEVERAPVPASQPKMVTQTQAFLMAFGSGLLALILALALTLALMAAINGGRLRFASPTQVDALNTRFSGLQTQTNTLETDLSALRSRVDNLDSLSGRVNTVEQSIEDLQAGVDATTRQVENLSGQVDEVTTQVETLQEQSSRFSSFLEGLNELMGSLFAVEGGGK
ncbi:MAG: helix-hairpin-helix domain-containing protein [Anaerolineales bacterium]|jgi:prefoldin subunit 5